MITFKEWFKLEHPTDVFPEGEVKCNWFDEMELPMIVECTCCGSTMVLFSAYIDEKDYVYCASCAGEE